MVVPKGYFTETVRQVQFNTHQRGEGDHIYREDLDESS